MNYMQFWTTTIILVGKLIHNSLGGWAITDNRAAQIVTIKCHNITFARPLDWFSIANVPITSLCCVLWLLLAEVTPTVGGR